MRRWASSLLFVLLSLGVRAASAQNPAPWTYFFYINGDLYYSGPDFLPDGKIKVVDESWALYRQATALAEADRRNNYVIFFDPKKRDRFFSSGKPRIEIYRKARRLETERWQPKQVDSTQPVNFVRMVEAARSKLGAGLVQGDRLLYFYGEHVSAEHGVPYDLRSPGSPFTFTQFRQALGSFMSIGGIQLLVMHSCYMNTFAFLELTAPFTESLLVANGPIPNSPLRLASQELEWPRSPEELARRIMEDSSSLAAHPQLVYFGPEYRELVGRYAKLKAKAQLPAYSTVRSSDELSSHAIDLQVTRELVLPQEDFISLLVQSGAEETTADAVESWVHEHPVYGAVAGLVDGI